MPSETPVLDTLELMTAASLANCQLGTRELMLVRLAALAATDAPASSYLMNITASVAADAGVTLQDAQDVLAAVAPIVGTVRVVTAAANITEALGFFIAAIIDAELEAEEG